VRYQIFYITLHIQWFWRYSLLVSRPVAEMTCARYSAFISVVYTASAFNTS